MAKAFNISLWENFDEDHWLRSYGRTQVIVIDDQWYSDKTFEVPSRRRKELEKKLNVSFHFFDPPIDKIWNEAWFSRELERVKDLCKEPAAILLDLMFGEQKTPDSGSGKMFLKLLSEDDRMSTIPIMIITAGREEIDLLKMLKTEGGSLKVFLEKYNPTDEPFSDRLEAQLLEFALLSDPNIHAYSFSMRKIAQELRKIVIDPEMIEEIKKEKIPKSTLLIGHSGDGKNFLAEYLQRISERNKQAFEVMSFSDVSDPRHAEPMLFGSLPYENSSKGRIRLDSRTGQRHPNGDLILSIVGMVTNADNGTLLIDELGNSPAEMQTKILRFLDKREISPLFHSEYIPKDRPYNIWVLMTVQPKHKIKLRDLDRRMNKMMKITIPPLKERGGDVIPMAVYALDHTLQNTPNHFFTEDALEWLGKRASVLTAGNLTAMVSVLMLESSKFPYNSSELDRAYKRLDTTTDDVSIVVHAEHEVLSADTKPVSDNSFQEGMLNDLIRRTVDYVFWAIEKNKWNNKPQYPKTWHTISGEYIKNSSQCQRNIGNMIFQISNEELVTLMSRSVIFKEAVFTCGKKVHSAKKRLPELKKMLDFQAQ